MYEVVKDHEQVLGGLCSGDYAESKDFTLKPTHQDSQSAQKQITQTGGSISDW